ncbi:BTAD domain-containing putative transcriptional regulator [Nonomuraea typhae]|uniref:BTAD domain-containing putative transcriptional regulator n=1 Tax=Nonomuraea typhae TaxID=2603600 RepID=UPI0012F89568|nr:BTAD domain-containing putative transcriptional regulator [Nonomuraea typhae]
MRFGVLGPLAVWGPEGAQVRVPEVKVRTLLAHLLLAPGRVVPADRLIDSLWSGALPANPTGALQTRVSQLRRIVGKESVVSGASGYRLEVAPSEVDTGRFQTLLTEARALDGAAKAALLADALALWRGPALIDFADEEFARPEIARLEELRLTALEEHAEARLDLGEHALLADELGDLVARHPLRERLRAAHLRALYRAGRQKEALDSYADLRVQLDEELGLVPGPDLAGLHQAILRQDPALDPPVVAARRTNLPVPLTDLIGRDADVAAVTELLYGSRLVTLTGPGGVGKTRLAVETAQRAARPDGVWLVELAGATGGEVAEVVAATLGVRDEGPSLAVRLAEALRGKDMLLVLDNCEHVTEPVARLAALLLGSAPSLRILATSQEPLGVAGEQLWNVPALPQDAAERLFVARASAAAPGVELDAASVATICRRLDGIPLALELAATRVRALGVRELSARLDDRFRVLEGGRNDAPARQRTLRAMIDWSWELLGPDEQVVLRRLAVHADGCTLEAAEAVCGEDALPLLPRLVDRSLVVVTEGPRYRLLESVAAYCVERLRDAGEAEEIRRRHREYYVALAERAEPYLRGPEQRQWLLRLDAEAANFRAAAPSERLVNALAWYWVLRGRLGEGQRYLAQVREGGDITRTWLAAFTLRTGEAVTSVPAPRAVDDLGYIAGLARAQAFLAAAQLGIGDLNAGEELAARAARGFSAIGDQWGLAFARSVQARQALLRSSLDAAHSYGRESLELFAELGDRWGQSHAGFAVAWHAEVVGDYAEAARVHRDGLRMAEELGLWTEVADKFSLLGRLALLEGSFEQADSLHRRAKVLAGEQGYTVGEEFAGLGLALSYRRQGRLDEAEAELLEWIDWDHALDSDAALALIQAELGFVAEMRGDLDGARARHRESLARAEAVGDPRAVALAFEGLAGVAASAAEGAYLLGRAAGLRASVGAPLPEGERFDVDRITARLQGDGFEAEYVRGFESI